MPTTLVYQTLTPAITRSRWGLVALGCAIAANLLFAWDVAGDRWIGQPAYRAIAAGVPGAYDYYGNLKIVAVTLFIASLILIAAGTVAAFVALCQRRKRKLPALIAVLLMISQLLITAVMR